MKACDMRGFLSFLVLWIIRKRSMTGAEIAEELERRKGSRPSPGTIYPALKDLRDKGLIDSDKGKVYSLTKKGEEELDLAVKSFCTTFSDMDEMQSCCGK